MTTQAEKLTLGFFVDNYLRQRLILTTNLRIFELLAIVLPN